MSWVLNSNITIFHIYILVYTTVKPHTCCVSTDNFIRTSFIEYIHLLAQGRNRINSHNF